MDYAKRVAEILLDTESVKVQIEDPFTWTSGMRAPVYCDNRRLISFPSERSEVVDGLMALVEQFGEIDCLAGTSTAGIPWAAFVAERLGKPMVYVRSKPKGHGAGRQVEGTMAKGARVLVVEDHFSTGGSSLVTVDALKREYEADVAGIVAISMYDFVKMRDNFAEAAVEYKTLTDFGQIGSLLVERGQIGEAERESLMEFMQDPQGWWKE